MSADKVGAKRKSDAIDGNTPAAATAEVAATDAAAAPDTATAPATATAAAAATSSPSKLSDEQKKRVAENKAKAEEKLRSKRQKTDKPAVAAAKEDGDADADAADSSVEFVDKPKGGSKGKGKGKASKAVAATATASGSGSGSAKSSALDGKSEAEIYASLEDLITDEGWKRELAAAIAKPEFKKLKASLVEAAKAGKTIYPPAEKIFNAFNHCKFDDVRVVIIGQDPYHGPGQAEGLCFSVAKGVPIPSSLGNMFKELGTDLGAANYRKPTHGSLLAWADQGVLLLNTLLTVEKATPMAHKGLGWEKFTDAVIDALNRKKQNLVFLLWGKPAQQKGKGVSTVKHKVLTAAHPSGLSASKGFYGCKHFSKTNELLTKMGLPTIKWQT